MLMALRSLKKVNHKKPLQFEVQVRSTLEYSPSKVDMNPNLPLLPSETSEDSTLT